MTFLGHIIVLLLSSGAIIGTSATLILHLKNDTFESDLYIKAVYASTAPYPFNVRGRLYVMHQINIEELQSDLSGVIVLGNANSTSDEQELTRQIYERNGSGYIAQYPDYVMFFKTMVPLPFVCILNNDADKVSKIWEQLNHTLFVTIMSDDNYELFRGKSGGSVFLLVINLVILLATLSFVCYQLHSFKDGAAVTKIALLGVLLSNLGLIADRIVTFLLIYTNSVSMTIIPPITIIGPTFIAFSALFISLYWSALAFPKVAKTKSKQVFLPVLGICVLSLIAYAACMATEQDRAVTGLQIAFVIIIFVSATYFIVVGAILINIVKKGNKIMATKRKISKRLMYMLILAGISMYGIVIIGMFISLYRPNSASVASIVPFFAKTIPSEGTFYATRALLNLFCACSVVTFAALFKKPKEKVSVELKVATSDEIMKTPNSRHNEAR